MIGTLIWVGDTSAAEFRGAVEFCLLHVAQLAFRRDVAEAGARPASDVRWIVYAHRHRDQFDDAQLAADYPHAKSLHLLGSLVQGHRHSLGGTAIDWHQWDQVLPGWLGLALQPRPKCRTIVVVAASLAIAEPLLELAGSYGATAIWSRHAGDHSVRNVDAVWWDDSVANPVAAHQWRLRTKLFARRGRPVEHAWITHTGRIDDHQNALIGGVRVIAAKPYGTSRLVAMLEQQAPVLRPRAHAA